MNIVLMGAVVAARKLKLVKRSDRFEAPDLFAWRERHGLDQAQTGEALGVSKRAIYYYEAGERKIPRTLALVADAYDRGYPGP
jgi:predicted transcriptional regulator